MTQHYVGDQGGFAVALEDVAYGTAGAAKVWQHPTSADLKTQKELIEPPTLGTAPYIVRNYGVGFAQGGAVLPYDDSRAVVGPILATVGTLSTDDYTFGSGSAPDNDSLTAWKNVGGIMYQYVGCMIASLRWDLAADLAVMMTVGWLGREGTKETPVSPSPPDVAGIVYESDLGTITLGGVACVIMGASIQVDIVLDGANRHGLGASVMKAPVRTGRQPVTATLNLELADVTGEDTVAQADKYLAGTPIGDVVIDDWELENCYMAGDMPDLAAGITKFDMNLVGSQCILTTTA